MPPRRSWTTGLALCLVLCAWGPSAPASARDVLSIGSVSLASPGQILQIPIYLRDSSGTALGADVGINRRIQSLAFSIEVTPASAVGTLSLDRAGITAGPTPRFETQDQVGDRVYAILSFDGVADPLVTTSDSAFPGEVIAMLTFEIAKSFLDGGTVHLDFVPQTAALGNGAGFIVERVQNGRLRLVGGTILVDDDGIFADGFEVGDTSGWTASFP